MLNYGGQENEDDTSMNDSAAWSLLTVVVQNPKDFESGHELMRSTSNGWIKDLQVTSSIRRIFDNSRFTQPLWQRDNVVFLQQSTRFSYLGLEHDRHTATSRICEVCMTGIIYLKTPTGTQRTPEFSGVFLTQIPWLFCYTIRFIIKTVEGISFHMVVVLGVCWAI